MGDFVDRLQGLKKIKGKLQKDVSIGVDIPLRTYQRYERGERVPDMLVLIKLANYFDVSIDYLVGRTDKPDINR
jgi:Predicted transcriptional regulators